MVLTLSNQDLGTDIRNYFLMVRRVKQRNRLPVEVSHLPHWKICRIGHTVQNGLYCRTDWAPQSGWALAVSWLCQNKKSHHLLPFPFPVFQAKQNEACRPQRQNDFQQIPGPNDLGGITVNFHPKLQLFDSHRDGLGREMSWLTSLQIPFSLIFLVICCRK